MAAHDGQAHYTQQRKTARSRNDVDRCQCCRGERSPALQVVVAGMILPDNGRDLHLDPRGQPVAGAGVRVDDKLSEKDLIAVAR